MQEYWETVAPPLDVIIASFMGWKPRKRSSKGGQAKEEYGNLNDLLSMFPGGTIQ